MLLLFHDLPLLLKYCFSDLFADDATFHTSSPEINIFHSELQSDLESAKTWRTQNKMAIHCVRTTYMLVDARHLLDDTGKLTLHIDDDDIERVTQQVILRIIIEEQLSWRHHTLTIYVR